MQAMAKKQMTINPRKAGTKVPAKSYAAPTTMPENDPNTPTPVRIHAWIYV